MTSSPAPIDYLVDVMSVSPLRLRFSFFHGDESRPPAFVPRLIRPIGYFVEVVVRAPSGEVVHRTTRPKVEPKLDPSRDDSYLELEPGYSYGAVLEEPAALASGAYVVVVTYSNREFTGSANRPVGELRWEAASDVAGDGAGP